MVVSVYNRKIRPFHKLAIVFKAEVCIKRNVPGCHITGGTWKIKGFELHGAEYKVLITRSDTTTYGSINITLAEIGAKQFKIRGIYKGERGKTETEKLPGIVKDSFPVQ